MRGVPLLNWFSSISIARKLYFTVGIMAVLIGVELFALFFSINTLSSVRAYVGGEGLWSKAQKDAIYRLTLYGNGGKEEDYRAFQEFMKVPLGDAKARAELAKPQPDLEVVRQGFLQGRNNPEDIDGMTRLFRRFHRISYIHRAIEVWTEAEPLALQLVSLANQLHAEINSPNPSQQKIEALLRQIAPLNEKLTALEDEFSYTLGEGSRWLEGVVLRLLFLIALTVEITGLLLAISVSRSIQKGLSEIINAAREFATGKLKTRARVFSGDEIGELATSFNLMSDQLEANINELEQAHTQFRTLLESAPEAMIIMDLKGTIKLVNAQTETLFHNTRNKLLGQPIEKLIPTGFTFLNGNHSEIDFNGPELRDWGKGREITARRSNGETFAAEVSLSPLQTEEGTWISAAMRDITTRKTAQTRLAQYTRELEVKNKELEQFAYVASHDLQEPLRTVTSFVELLQKEHGRNFDVDERLYMQFIVEASLRMKNQIKALLDYSRLGSGREPRPTNLNQLIKDVLIINAPLIQVTGATVQAGSLPDLTVYPVELKIMFENLLLNALKFRHPSRPAVINITAEDNGDYWKFAVSDNGIGIDSRYLQKIFIIFQRLHNRDEYEGTGIGLAMCKKIAEIHGGTIWAESTPDSGSTFYFTIAKNRWN